MLRMLISALLMGMLSTSAPDRGTAGNQGSLSGPWILTEHFPDDTHVHRMSLEVTGNQIKGQSGPSKIEGDISDAGLTLKWLTPDGQRVDATYTGKVQGETLKGEGEWGGLKLQWEARRPAGTP